MTTKKGSAKVNVMKLQSDLNAALKAEQKSFSAVVQVITSLKNTEVMKIYLKAADLTFEQLINLDYFKGNLTYATFPKGDGTTFEHIARKDYKTKEWVKAKWSFWLILNAARKTRKAEVIEMEKRKMLAKENSLKALENEEKEG